MATKYVQCKKTKLTYPISRSQTTGITLDELKKLDGTDLSASDFGDVTTLSLGSGTSREEIISFTSFTRGGDNKPVLSGVVRGLKGEFPYGIGGFATDHGNGEEVVVTNNPQLYASLANLLNDQTFSGINTFTQPIVVADAVNGNQAVSKAQLDSAVFSGAVDGDTVTTGLTRLSTNSDRTVNTATITIASPAVITTPANHGLTANDSIRFTSTGALPTGLVIGTRYYVISTGLTATTFRVSATKGGTAINTSGTQSGVHTVIKTTPTAISINDYRLPENAFSSSTGSANAYALTLTSNPTAYAGGQMYSFIANFTNTGSATLNVAGLGARTIKKGDGTVDLASGDIVSGMIVEVAYNSVATTFTMLNPVANAPTVQPASNPSQTATSGETLATGDVAYISDVAKTYTYFDPLIPVIDNHSMGQNSGNLQTAQSIQEAFQITFNKIQVRISKNNNPVDNIVYAVQADNANAPSGTDLATVSVVGGTITTTPTDYVLTLSTQVEFAPNTRFWIVARRSSGTADATNYYVTWGKDGTNPYANGTFSQFNGTSWTNSGTSDDGRIMILTTTAGLMYKMNKNTPHNTDTPYGFVMTGVASGASATMQIGGGYTTTGLTAGARYYASNTIAGAITATKPTTTTIRYVGFASSTTNLVIRNPQSSPQNQQEFFTLGNGQGNAVSIQARQDTLVTVYTNSSVSQTGSAIIEVSPDGSSWSQGAGSAFTNTPSGTFVTSGSVLVKGGQYWRAYYNGSLISAVYAQYLS